MEDMTPFSIHNKDAWLWTMMIMQPEFVTTDLFSESVSEVGKKKELPALGKIRFEAFPEGQAAQIMHIGPYAAEEPTMNRLHAYIHEQGYELAGKHHEIYLKDPRKSAPEKLQTASANPSKGRLLSLIRLFILFVTVLSLIPTEGSRSASQLFNLSITG